MPAATWHKYNKAIHGGVWEWKGLENQCWLAGMSLAKHGSRSHTRNIHHKRVKGFA